MSTAGQQQQQQQQQEVEEDTLGPIPVSRLEVSDLMISGWMDGWSIMVNRVCGLLMMNITIYSI